MASIYRTVMVKKTTALWDLNESCNLHCQYCYHIMNGEDWSGKQQSLEIIQSTMSSLRSAGVDILHFVGGEPFLRRDLRHIAGDAKQFGFETRVTTNGTVLPAYRDAAFMRLFDLIEVSLDSLDDAYMAEIRTVRRVETIKTAISELVAGGYGVQVLAVANKLNFQFLPELIEWCLQQGIKSLKIQPIFLPQDNRNFARLSLEEAELKALRRLAEEIYQPHPELSQYYQYNVECANGRSRRHLCNAFSRFLYLSADGQVMRCPSLAKPLAQPDWMSDDPKWCNQMSHDCLCVYSLIENFEFVLKNERPNAALRTEAFVAAN